MNDRRIVEFTASEEDVGVRLDVALARKATVSRATAVRMIESGDVTVDGARAAKSLKLEPNVLVHALLPADPEPPAPEDIDVRIVYEDDALLVISKPAGLVVHPAPGHRGGTLVNALLATSTPTGGEDEDRPGIV
ncbi:MAG TPA: S4 domain-containing protein, partial [Actinomycetota bacterium]|nr:S4 domain-containing protein [Actinomycetota bacterium]